MSEAGAYLEKNMSDVLDIAEMSPIKEEEEEEEEKDEEDLQEDGEKHEEEGTEKGNLDVLCLSNYFFSLISRIYQWELKDLYHNVNIFLRGFFLQDFENQLILMA